MEILGYDDGLFTKILYALIGEFITETEGNINILLLHLPKIWKDSPNFNITGINYIHDTEETLEIEITWEDPKSGIKDNFIAVKMMAPL